MFASSYGTFVTALPGTSPPPPEQTQEMTTGRRSSSWQNLNGLSSLGQSNSTSSSSPPPLPVHYRCLLLPDEAAGGVVGLRLGWIRGRLRVTAVLSPSVQGVCLVEAGDVVTHVNGEPVVAGAGGRAHGGKGKGKGKGGGGREGLRQLLRRHADSGGLQTGPAGMVELRLIRARTLWEAEGGEEEGEQEAAASASKAKLLLYETHPRDTLSSIAACFATTEQELRTLNREIFPAGERAPPALQPGLLLRIGAAPTPPPPWTTPKRFPPPPPALPASYAASASSFSLPPSSASPSSTPPQQRRYHVVGEGESLAGIAAGYGVSVMDLRRWNRGLFPVGEAGRAVAPGDRLLLFCSRVPVVVGPAAAAAGAGGSRRGMGAGGKGSAPIAIATVNGGGNGTDGASPSPE